MSPLTLIAIAFAQGTTDTGDWPIQPATAADRKQFAACLLGSQRACDWASERFQEEVPDLDFLCERYPTLRHCEPYLSPAANDPPGVLGSYVACRDEGRRCPELTRFERPPFQVYGVANLDGVLVSPVSLELLQTTSGKPIRFDKPAPDDPSLAAVNQHWVTQKVTLFASLTVHPDRLERKLALRGLGKCWTTSGRTWQELEGSCPPRVTRPRPTRLNCSDGLMSNLTL